jgi:RNA polymerase sigma-70 factor, ECF subfamily
VSATPALFLTLRAPACKRAPVPVPDRGGKLAQDHLDALQAFALKLCGHPADARDLVQDTFERALRNLGTLTPGTNERAWLFTILHNMFIDRCRHRARRPQADTLDEEKLQVASVEPEPPPAWTAISETELRAAVARLDEEFRVVYELHALEGRSYQEIVEKLGIPANTVGTRLIRARRKLKAILAEGLR